MRNSVTLTLGAILTVFVFQVYAQQQSSTVSGFIIDHASGEALPGVNILIYQDSIHTVNPPVTGTTTNAHGFYAIPQLSGGDYILVYRHIGYKLNLQHLHIDRPEERVQVNVELNPEEIELEEVFVRGEKENRVDISAVDISPQLLEQLPSLSGEVDLFRMLEMLPGVNRAGELSNGLYVRGGSPDQTLTLVDGVIMYNPAHLGNIASTFNTNAIQDIRLIKGAFPSEYGGRLSSVLDVKLRTGTRERFKGNAGLGLISSHALIEGPLGEKSTYMFSGRKMYYDMYQRSFDKDGAVPRYNFYDLNGKINYTLSETDVVSISGLFNRDNILSPPATPDGSYNINWDNSILSVNWLHINSKSVLLSSTVSYVNYGFQSIINDDQEAVSSADYYSSSELTDFYLKQDVELHLHQDHTSKIGAEMAIHGYDLVFSNSYDELLDGDPFTAGDLSAVEAAAYVQNTWQVTPLLKTTLGGRFYYFNDQKYFKFEPRISASYILDDGLSVKAAFAQAHQFLHLVVRNDISLPTDLWYPSTSSIGPGKSTQVVAGIEKYLSDNVYLLSLEAYYKDMKNLLEFTTSTFINRIDESIEQQLTVGEGEAYGVELFVNKRSGTLTGWLGYTLSWTKRRFENLNGGRVFSPPYDRRHDVSLVLAYQFSEQLSAGLTWTYASGQGQTIPTGQYVFPSPGLSDNQRLQFNYTGRNEYKLPDYHKMDINISYTFDIEQLPLELYLNIYNVYNRSNPFAQYVTLPEENENGGTVVKPVVKQITLFPFLPTFGINLRF